MKPLNQNKISILIIFLVTFGFTSCLDEGDPGEIAHGDAFIRAYWSGDSVVYNTELYTYSWYEMKTVTAYSGNDTTQLSALDDYQFTFSYVPERVSFSTTAPTAAQYYFDILLENGTEYTATDYLKSQTINPPIVSELSWDSVYNRIQLEWEAVEDADYYRVILVNTENENVFDTDLLLLSTKSLSISVYSNGWNANKQPNGNTTFKVLVYAYLFEPEPSTFDIQCIAVNDRHSIEWMPESRE